MPSPTAASPAGTRVEDQRVALYDVSWADFEVILHIRGDRAGVRLTYLNGVLELMSPSVDHEGIKTTIGRLLEAYAEERALTLNGFGSWTLKNPLRARALEPDECYSLSEGRPTRPDIAIEVVWSPAGSTSCRCTPGWVCAKCGSGAKAQSTSTSSSASGSNGASAAGSCRRSSSRRSRATSTPSIRPNPSDDTAHSFEGRLADAAALQRGGGRSCPTSTTR